MGQAVTPETVVRLGLGLRRGREATAEQLAQVRLSQDRKLPAPSTERAFVWPHPRKLSLSARLMSKRSRGEEHHVAD